MLKFKLYVYLYISRTNVRCGFLEDNIIRIIPLGRKINVMRNYVFRVENYIFE